MTFPLVAQKVYTDLTRPQEVRAFTEVSDNLICQCGCNFVLSSCPHTECPWGIPARRLIESRIQSGDTAAQVIADFEQGFKDKLTTDPVARSLLMQGRADLYAQFRDGYGPSIRARTPPYFLIALSVAALVLAFFTLRLFWQKNRRPKNLPQESGLAKGAQIDDWTELDR
ncbi:MAG: hypothetical protein HS115_06280 [Spirochaetales bacterium]|nr:hypothetical protein [Spirochaetales bacterium]